MFEQAIGAMASVVVDPYLLGLIFVTTIFEYFWVFWDM